LFVLRSLDEALFKGGDGHLDICRAARSASSPNRILGVGSVGNPGMLFFGSNIAVEELARTIEIPQHYPDSLGLS
jgi:hypothetical protein